MKMRPLRIFVRPVTFWGLHTTVASLDGVSLAQGCRNIEVGGVCIRVLRRCLSQNPTKERHDTVLILECSEEALLHWYVAGSQANPTRIFWNGHGLEPVN